MAQYFNNNSSECSFIGNRRLEEVIASDERELNEIGGGFEAIGDRMLKLVKKIENEYSTERDKKRTEIFKKYGYNTNNFYDVPGNDEDISTPRGKICQETKKLFNTQELVPGETEIEVAATLHTRGFQLCPFEGCRGASSSSDYVIRNRRTGKRLTINQITAHLAKVHHLLEKDNDYGISAKEFYESFM